MICAYFLTYYLIPTYLYKKRYWTFVFSFVAVLLLVSLFARFLTVYFAEPLYDRTAEKESLFELVSDPLYLILVYVPTIWFFPILMAMIKIFKDRYKEREKSERLKREKTKAELNFLKAQIHPHFLLNTLNNLYALTLKKSDKAPETVIKLSDMLVYILYKCDEKFVLLDNEIKLIENYISLERLRYGDKLHLEFNQTVDDKNCKIAPLILLSIVENAFKHGVSGETDNAEVKINLNQSEDSFLFEVFNTKSEVKQKDQTDYTKGIGIGNVKRQLDLVYPDKFVFDVGENERDYKVTLKIFLRNED